MLTVGGLFSGIGGWELGLERAGMRVLWHCEADEFCARVLARRFPGRPVYPDVRGLRGADLASVDVLCGGFPCQDISLAGKGAGIGGSRSGLWGDFARLIGELRPRYVLVENVAALASRGLDVVLGDLAALGFDAEWDCLPASAFGAPHRRDRLWLVAYPNGEGEPGDTVNAQPGRGVMVSRGGVATDADGTGLQGRSVSRSGSTEVSWVGDGCALADTEGTALGTGLREGEQGGLRRGRPSDSRSASVSWLTEPDVGRVAHGIPARVDRLRSLGNALVPQISEWIGRRILEWESR